MDVSQAHHCKTIWCLLDGRHGHQNQVLGLADQLAQKTDTHTCCIDLSTTAGRLATIHRSSQQLSGSPERPDLIIGAGHRTHLPLVVLRHRFAARSVVLMKPSLPFHWFDYCLVPGVHDLQDPPPNVLETKGVLNRVAPGAAKRKGGIMLIGGPSAHYHWSDLEICSQIRDIVSHSSQRWTVATSRRTPASFLKNLANTTATVDLVPPADTTPGWLPAQLAQAETAWVTEDSVSMMYEALTSGAKVGVLELNRRRDNRVTECTDVLVRDGDARRWSDWTNCRVLSQPAHPVWEAERCARTLLERMNWKPQRSHQIPSEAA